MAPGLPLAEVARRLGAELLGGSALPIIGVAPLESAGPGELSFFTNPRYRAALQATRAAAVLVDEAHQAAVPDGVARLVTPQPYVAFAKAVALFHPAQRPPAGVHPAATVAETARVDPLACVMAGAVVGPAARVGARTVVYPGAAVLEGAVVGADCVLWSGAVVRERCLLGDRVILQPNAVVGSDGFGFAFDLEGEGHHPGPSHRKIPQVGIVRIEDDVEVGACSCIDRAALGETVIGRGTKIDNLVQVAHNVRVGPLSLLVAQCGISGSTTLGMGTVIAGQAGVVGHLTLGDGVQVAAQSGVMDDLADGSRVSGSPAMPHGEWLRAMAALPRMPELLKEVRRLAQRVQELESKAFEAKAHGSE